MKIGIILAAILVLPQMVLGSVIHVPGNQPNIQAGITAAIDGDTVMVADGTYSGEGNFNIELQGKQISVMSQNGPEKCMIDYADPLNGYPNAFYIHQGETNGTLVEGFTIRNSLNSLNTALYIFESSPVISNCIIRDYHGAGIYLWTSDSTLSNCIIAGLSTFSEGAGINIKYSNVNIINCEISDNIGAFAGGGIAIENSTTLIQDCIISGNSLSNDTNTRCGGGIYCYDESIVTISNSTIENNTADTAGGISSTYGSIMAISGCTIRGNSAQYAGGGLNCSGYLAITQCLISENVASFGAGIFISYGLDPETTVGGSPEMANTFQSNVGGYGADIFAGEFSDQINAAGNHFKGNHLSPYYVAPQECFNLDGCVSETEPIQGEFYISPGGNDSNNGLTPETPFKTIRKVLKSILPSEEIPTSIHLMPGTYSPSTNGEIFPLPILDHVSMAGEDATAVILNAEGSQRVLMGYEAGFSLSGMTVTGGLITWTDNSLLEANNGAGLYAKDSSVKLNDMIFTLNLAGIEESNKHGGGGGIYLKDSDLDMSGCVCSQNYCLYKGAGLYFYGYKTDGTSIKIMDSQFIGNYAEESAGGIEINLFEPTNLSIIITGCQLSDNYKGGIRINEVANNPAVEISNCIISRNQGTGISVNGNAKISSCQISENVNESWSSGIAVSYGDLEITNCIITGNESQHHILSVYSNNNFKLTNSTIAGNKVTSEDKTAIFIDMSFTARTEITNCIMWNDAPEEIFAELGYNTYLNLTNCCIRSPFPGVGNFQTDPGFIGNGNYHLRNDSSCIDNGSDIEFPGTDFDGRERPSGGAVDVGAYEYDGWPNALRTYVDMPGHHILSWDPFWFSVEVWNPLSTPLEGLPLFVILGAGGQYFFAPAFNDFDCYRPTFPPGLSSVSVIPEMTWPSGVGNMNGILWITAITDPEMTAIISNIGMYSFGWSD